MQKNIYYRASTRRENIFKKLFFHFFNLFSSEARIILEVFIRKNFGERYFRLSHVFIHATVLATIPIVFTFIHNTLFGMDMGDDTLYGLDDAAPAAAPSARAVWMPGSKYLLWYVFIVGFIAIGIKHYRDKARQPSVFDFAKYSLYSGELQSFVKALPYFNEADRRTGECFLEPALFLVPGILLTLTGQYLGWLLIICSFFYCVAYIADYEWGDEFVMDRIDEIICNQAMEQVFVNDEEGAEEKGFAFRGRRPNGEHFRRQILDTMFDDDDVLIAE